MGHKRLLIETQLSNYDTNGKFILECDSGWQMVMGRVREMLRLNPHLYIDVMLPMPSQLMTQAQNVNEDLFTRYADRLRLIYHHIIPNALATRYDFDFRGISCALNLAAHKKDESLRYDAVYINDPMHLRTFKALFLLEAGYRPKYYVHSHFIDVPECPKFPTEASLWLGQCEAALRADYNFWQCESAMNQFFDSMSKLFVKDVVDDVRAKSMPWDDGYSIEEITSPINVKNMRFTEDEWNAKVGDKFVIFVPNRIGGKGRSSDYTNCGKFMFELLPKLREKRQDFVVICGNPSQKIFNYELEEWCGKYGYVSLVPDAFNRDEFKFVARNSDIAVGLYDKDTYGGTAARELVELGCMPLWLDVNEYSSIAREANGYPYVVKPDWSNFVHVANCLLNYCQYPPKNEMWIPTLQRVIRERCSYESTTSIAMARMDLHVG